MEIARQEMWQLEKWKNLNFKESSRQFGRVGQNAISGPNQQGLLLQCTQTSSKTENQTNQGQTFSTDMEQQMGQAIVPARLILSL